MFAVYFVMHNQLCWPTKASYTVEMSGHDSPDSTYQGGGPTTVGGEISKSTQNLISAMEEVDTHTHIVGHQRESRLKVFHLQVESFSFTCVCTCSFIQASALIYHTCSTLDFSVC